ncbi:hypothetical protein CLIB1423_04S06040 [[Candida] railenensis]|uniref:Uncharacterized protein n=1 Tax=[Candida] railenensis TaxID=45579 RepID=A0A9P0QN41_9ASCO|nr:hypothetical protein CLIB1423_04S06040 [[Candida] railenensis]
MKFDDRKHCNAGSNLKLLSRMSLFKVLRKFSVAYARSLIYCDVTDQFLIFHISSVGIMIGTGLAHGRLRSLNEKYELLAKRKPYPHEKTNLPCHMNISYNSTEDGFHGVVPYSPYPFHILITLEFIAHLCLNPELLCI